MKLYIAHVGFYDDVIGMYELHSNIFVVAEDIQTAKEKVKKNDIFISKKMHIDAIQELHNIDGYEIRVVKNDCVSDNQIFDYDAIKRLT